MLKVQTLSGDTLTLPPMSVSTWQTERIMDSLVESLYVAKADVGEVMSMKVAKEPWELPCRWTEKFAEEGLVVASSKAPLDRPIDTSRAYQGIVKRVEEDGKLAPEILKAFQHYVGWHATAYTFETREHKYAVQAFALDTACLLWEVSTYKVADSERFGVKLRRGAHLPFIGVYATEVSPNFIQDYLTTPRGYVEFETRDLLDRIRSWAIAKLPADLDIDVTFRQLALLKLQRSPSIVYRLEQKLLDYTPIVFEDASLAQLMFTDDNLQSIREQWFSTKPAMERYRDLYDAMVPTYIDHDQFMEMFPKRPADVVKFTYTLDKQIASGIEKFIAFFQARQRYLKRKRV